MRTFRIAVTAAMLFLTASAHALAVSAPTGMNTKPVDDNVWHTYVVSARPLTSAPAPADEYFGRYKLSFLGVRNIIRDMNVEGDSPLALPLQEGRIHEVAGSIADWANRYPRDTWLPGTTASFVRFLERKGSADTSLLAETFIAYLNDRFGSTHTGKWYAALAKAHVTITDVDPTTAAAPFRIYGPFDPDVLRLDRVIPKP
ncbi:MAG TPA: hypothetical protein VJN22_06630 [Candidatus Eremiobacteraceae bacterium]|nr:hypothetical protein [Candidatus Eremiobacteraceae bacterium]